MVFNHKIIFFDEDEDKIKNYQKIIGKTDNFLFKWGRFEDLIQKNKIQIVVSPANSLLNMSGGIDKVYADNFPGIEDKLRTKMIAKAYKKTKLEYNGTKYVLPVGKAIICETGNAQCPFIISSPTMSSPKVIKTPKNIYLCMKAILKKLAYINIPITIACPCLGTGIGALPADKSAKQVKKALDEIPNLFASLPTTTTTTTAVKAKPNIKITNSGDTQNI